MRPNVRLAMISGVAAMLVLVALWGAAVAMDATDGSPSDGTYPMSPGAVEVAIFGFSVLTFFMFLWAAFLLAGLAIRWLRQPAPLP